MLNDAKPLIMKGRSGVMKVKRILCLFIALAMVCLVVACVSESVADGGGGSAGGAGSGGDNGDGSGSDNGGDSGTPTPTPAPTPSQTPGGAQKPDPGDGGENTEEPDGGDATTPEPSPTPEPAPEPTQEPSPSPEPTPTPTPGNGGGSSLSGSASDVLAKLVEDLQSAGVSMPMSFPGPPPEVAAEVSHNTIGLLEDDFIRLVTSASYSQAAIGTFAHQISIIQAKDASAAAEVKRLVSGDNGFDPQKWICVSPERVSVIDSGAYVLIAASTVVVVEAAVDTFRNTAGSAGEVVTFWEFAG